MYDALNAVLLKKNFQWDLPRSARKDLFLQFELIRVLIEFSDAHVCLTGFLGIGAESGAEERD
jgi:hypothetical protein